MLWILSLVALGSAVGGVVRYLVGIAVHHRLGGGFPVGTLVVNIVGCAVIGFVMRYVHATDPANSEWRLFLTTGVCGGFTTFSAFGYDTVVLIEAGDYRGALAYVGASLLVSIAAVYSGIALARGLTGRIATA